MVPLSAIPQPVTSSGKLIAIEGIDGSGKQTQAKLLERALIARGHSVYATGFPQYDSWFGTMVGNFLNGELGPLDKVDPHFTALLYAGDRFEAKSNIEEALKEGKVVLVDRYIGSNLAHQVARAAPNKRAELMRWIEHLEYTIYGLPREALILYLRVPPQEAQKLVSRKSQRAYTSASHDLQETNLRHLEDAGEMYDMLSRSRPWATIQCFDAEHGTMRLPQDIAAEMLAAVNSVLEAKVKS
jgi:dTMP kinase